MFPGHLIACTILIAFCASPGRGSEVPDRGAALAERTMALASADTSIDALRAHYIRGSHPDTIRRFIREIQGTAGTDSVARIGLQRHFDLALKILAALSDQETVEAESGAACDSTLKSLACEFHSLELTNRRHHVLAGLLADLLASPQSASNGPRVVAGEVADTDTTVSRGSAALPGTTGSPPESGCSIEGSTSAVRPGIRLSTVAAAGSSVASAGVGIVLRIRDGLSFRSALEFFAYERRPSGVLLSAGLRYRSIGVWPGLSIGSGRPTAWLSLTARTPFGIDLGIMVGPAAGIRVGS